MSEFQSSVKFRFESLSHHRIGFPTGLDVTEKLLLQPLKSRQGSLYWESIPNLWNKREFLFSTAQIGASKEVEFDTDGAVSELDKMFSTLCPPNI